MTERQAWLLLAKAWDAAKEDCDGDFIPPRSIGLGQSLGLCPCVYYLEFDERISSVVADFMFEKIKAMPTIRKGEKYAGCQFKWNTDADGAKQRAEFCRKQAAKLPKKKKKKSA